MNVCNVVSVYEEHGDGLEREPIIRECVGVRACACAYTCVFTVVSVFVFM